MLNKVASNTVMAIVLALSAIFVSVSAVEAQDQTALYRFKPVLAQTTTSPVYDGFEST